MTRWGSQVRLLHRPKPVRRIRGHHRQQHAAVAQLVEQWTENPCVISSILIGGSVATPRGVAIFFALGQTLE